MLRICTLGGLSIARVDGPAPSVGATSARRRIALLAVLAANAPRGMPRDSLLPLFWPESDTDRARHALDQTLYALKRDLGADSLVLGREELTLNPTEITSDIGEFRAQLARGERAAAVETYTGAFLEGVFITGAPEFEKWADGVRLQLTRDFEEALEALATEAGASGDHEAAVKWWQRLAARNPRRTRVVVALMSELAEAGDRTTALRHADVYHTLVRDDEDVAPNPAVAALAEKIKREPPQAPKLQPPAAPAAALVPAVEATVAATTDAPTPASTLHAPDVAPAATRHVPKRRVAIAAAALFVILAVSTSLTLWRRPPASIDERAWILTADVENRTGDSVFEHSLDAALAAGLQQSAYVNVLPRARVQQTLARMGDARAASGTTLGRFDETLAREIAQREGVRAVVVTAIDRVDTSYVFTARLVDAATGNPLAAETSTARGRGEVIDALGELVRKLRRSIGESARELAQHDRPLPQATTRSLEALRKYSDGLAASAAGQRAAAIELWQQAVAADSDFALAHAELGAAYYFANDRPRGDAHFTRALALLDRLTDRERYLIRASAESWRGNRERAIELRRALLVEFPRDPTAWAGIGYDLVRLGRQREAIDAFTQQLGRDSANASLHINIATAHGALGEIDESLRHYAKAFALQPSFLRVNNVNSEYASKLVLAGRVADAQAAFDTLMHGDPDQRAHGERSKGLLAMYQGRYGEATDHFRNATLLSQTPRHELTEARNRLFLASAQREKGLSDSVRTQLLAAHALFRKAYFEPTFLMYMGKALATNGQLPLAAEVLDTLKRRARPDNPRDRTNVLVTQAEVSLARGRVDSAVAMLRLAYAADSSPYVSESLARALTAAGDVAGAVSLYERYASAPGSWYGAEGQPLGLVALRDIGRLYERMGDTARARIAYERTLARWTASDSDLVMLRDAREGLTRLRRTTPALLRDRR